MRRPTAIVLIVAGLSLALWPFLSVASLTGQVLAESPAVPGVEVSEDRHWSSALWNEHFELATRTYPASVSVDEATVALGEEFEADGYSSSDALFGNGALWKNCCGSYDAVLVKTIVNDGQVEQHFTVHDGDVQIVWGFFAATGAVLLLTGISLSRHGTTEQSLVEKDYELIG